MLAAIAWRNLWRNRRRTSITLVAIAGGLTGMLTMHAMMSGMGRRMLEGLVGSNLGHIQIHREGYRERGGATRAVDDADLILAAVREGYRLLPASLCAQEKKTIMGTSYETAVIMEKGPSSPPVEYKFLATKRVNTLQEELAKAVADGWSLNRLFLTYGEQMILLEKAGQ